MGVATFKNASLILLSPTITKLDFQMLPQTITVSKSAEWVSTEVIGRSEPYRAYRSSSPRSISFSLRLFASVDAGDGGDPWTDVKRKTDWLEALVYPERDTGYPPIVTFNYGNTFNSRCIVKSVSVKFEGPWQLRRPTNPAPPVGPGQDTGALSAGLAGVSLAQNLIGPISAQSNTAARIVSNTAGSVAAALSALGETKPGENGPHQDELLPMQAEVALTLDEINPIPRLAEDVRSSAYQPLSGPLSDPLSSPVSFKDKLFGLNNPLRPSRRG